MGEGQTSRVSGSHHTALSWNAKPNFDSPIITFVYRVDIIIFSNKKQVYFPFVCS